MKVKIEITVDIDPEAWMDEFGSERCEVRKEVKGFVKGEIMETLGDRGVLRRDVPPRRGQQERDEYRASLYEHHQPTPGTPHDRRCDSDLCHPDCAVRKRSESS